MMRKQMNLILKNSRIRNKVTPSQKFLKSLLNKNFEISQEFMETIKLENSNLFEYSVEFTHLRENLTKENQMKAFQFIKGKKNEKVDIECVKLEIEMSTNLNGEEREIIVLLIALKHIDEIISENATQEASNIRLSILFFLTTAYFKSDKTELSMKYANKIREHYLTLPKDDLNVGDQLFLFNAYAILISLYFEEHEEEEAKKFFEEVIEIPFEIENCETTILEKLATIHTFGSRVLVNENQTERAEKIIKKGIEICEKVGFDFFLYQLSLYHSLIDINLNKNLDLSEEYLLKSEKVIEHLMRKGITNENVESLIMNHLQLSLTVYRYDKQKIILIYEDLLDFVEDKENFKDVIFGIASDYAHLLLDLREYEKVEDFYYQKNFKGVIAQVMRDRVTKVRQDLQDGETDSDSIPVEELKFASKISVDLMKSNFTRCSIL
jgi:tetratricopeptide (TPR) repeat protein